MKHAMMLHLKSFLASPVNYLSAWRRYVSFGTQAQRWSDLTIFDITWDERTAKMAALVTPNSSVLEFGSGREQLERYLPEGCSYQPSDIVARSSRTLVCDLNVAFPALTQRYDVIVFSGVIEYIHDVHRLLQEVRRQSNSCILSYAPTDQLDCITTRVGDGWVNHLSEAALMAIISKAGFHVAERKTWRNQFIVKLT